ncbi:MAG: SUMF1/EgtB/PvdO family nonheme iron enzyme [Sedimentisphaerales bacterium]
MKFLLIAIVLLFGADSLFANSAPVVSNVTVSQRTDGSKLVDIRYNLSDADGDKCTVFIQVSSDGGNTWTVSAVSFNPGSAIGSNISAGTGKQIVWDCGADLLSAFGCNYRIKIIADDNYCPSGMVWVYVNDTGVSGHEGFKGYMSKYETTNAQYCQFLNAAKASNDITVSGSIVCGANGLNIGGDFVRQVYYDLAGTGSTSDGATNGGAARINWTGTSFTVDSGFEKHPVTYVSWYGATAFCNYYGYRLPTEWEWKAVADYDGSYTYGCGTTINNNIANYRDSTHPYGTSDVGSVGNPSGYGYGMCDMAGNVYEWTSSVYSGSDSVIRGGSWFGYSYECTTSNSNSSNQTLTYYAIGFRVCHNVEPTGMVWVPINDPGISGHEGFNGQMSKYETTNAQYCQYLNAAKSSNQITVYTDNKVYATSDTSHSQPYYNLAGTGYTGCGATNGGEARINWTGSSFTVDSGFDNHPVTYVSWYGSTAFANYYGYRLPTEWEWQAVADNTIDNPYLYGCGASIANSIANYLGTTHPDGTTVVGAFGTSGYGMADMAGNVWEWTSSCYYSDCSYDSRVIRGGCWSHPDNYCSVSYRDDGSPSTTTFDWGFRVCRSTLGATGYGISNVFTINNANLYIAFSSISEQQAGVDFNVTLTAKKETGQTETSFSGNLQLYVSGGPHLNMTSITLQNGVWNGTLCLDSAAHTVSIIAASGRFSGTSNVFSVTSTSSSLGRVEGKCVDSAGAPILGVPITVDLLKGGVVFASTTTNESTGRYSFLNVPSGIYDIEGHGASGNSTLFKNHSVIAGKTTTRDIKIYQAGIPVILVPGIMGSCTSPTRMRGSLNTKLTNLEFFDPWDKGVGWAKLTKALKQSGYEVFEAPWDWRREINDTTVNWYLKSVIDEAKRITARGKVHIIAHSLGGLLVRHYIQSDSYNNDIDKFAMVGTPNGGAAGDAYYLWEGADVDRIDDIYNIKYSFLYNICSDASEELHPWERGGGLGKNEIIWNVPQAQIKTIIQKNIPGLQHLMLISNELRAYPKAGGGYDYEDYPWKDSLITYKLSQNSNKSRLVPGNTEVVNDDQVRTRMFITVESTTVKCVVLNKVKSNPAPELYPLGSPTGKTLEDDGDGTVLWSSATFGLDFNRNFDYTTTTKTGSHAKLPGIYTEEIDLFLKESGASVAPSNSIQTTGSFQSYDIEEESVTQVTFGIDGRVQPILTSPGGQRLGIATETGDLVEELSGEISVKSDFSTISVTQPVDGTYMLDFTGDAGEVVNIAVQYAVGDNIFTLERSLLAGTETRHIGVVLDSSSEEPLQIPEPIGSIKNLTASSVTGMTQLQWDDLGDPIVAGYRVYGRRQGYRLFELLGEPTNSEYITSHPWSENETTQLWSYIVVSVTSDGQESFFDSTVTNQELLIARFKADAVNGEAPFTVTFTDQSTGNPTAWEWDFNADGVVDSTVQNPSWTYTERGNNTVICKVMTGDKSDTRIRTGYIEVTANILADGVDISDLIYMAEVWLTSDQSADIAPPPGGDGIVNLLDFAVLAEHWLSGQ